MTGRKKQRPGRIGGRKISFFIAAPVGTDRPGYLNCPLPVTDRLKPDTAVLAGAIAFDCPL